MITRNALHYVLASCLFLVFGTAPSADVFMKSVSESPDCVGVDVEVPADTIFPTGESLCVATRSLTTSNPVIVPADAIVNFQAPSIRLLNGFSVQSGGSFSAFGVADSLPTEVLDHLDQIPDEFTPNSEITLPNGQSMDQYINDRGITLEDLLPSDWLTEKSRSRHFANDTLEPEERKNDIIAGMLMVAKFFACGRDNPPCWEWDTEADPVDPIRYPAQQGATYVWGGKTPSIRTRPADNCTEETYGVDCSGMVYWLARTNGIDLPTGRAITQQDPEKWDIPIEWNLKMKKVTDGSSMAGDIVGWSNHIGIDDGAGKVISSTGGAGNCQSNILPPKGPRSLTFSGSRFGPVQTRLRLMGPEILFYTTPSIVNSQGELLDSASIRKIDLTSKQDDLVKEGFTDLAGLVVDNMGNLYFGEQSYGPYKIRLKKMDSNGQEYDLGLVVDTTGGYFNIFGYDFNLHISGPKIVLYNTPELMDVDGNIIRPAGTGSYTIPTIPDNDQVVFLTDSTKMQKDCKESTYSKVIENGPVRVSIMHTDINNNSSIIFEDIVDTSVGYLNTIWSFSFLIYDFCN